MDNPQKRSSVTERRYKFRRSCLAAEMLVPRKGFALGNEVVVDPPSTPGARVHKAFATPKTGSIKRCDLPPQQPGN